MNGIGWRVVRPVQGGDTSGMEDGKCTWCGIGSRR